MGRSFGLRSLEASVVGEANRCQDEPGPAAKQQRSRHLIKVTAEYFSIVSEDFTELFVIHT